MFLQMSELDQLERRREELAYRLRAIGRDFRSGMSRDSGERATELENRDTLFEIQRVTQEELARVETRIYVLEHALE